MGKITALKGLGKAFVKSLKKTGKTVEKKADAFAIKEIAKMNSKKLSDQINAHSKVGVPAVVYNVYKVKKDKKKK